MPDNIELDAGSGGSIIKTDDDGSAHWQYVKVAYGADNTQNIVTSTATNPLPVALSDIDNAVLDNIQTAVELIDNAVSGAGFNITQFGGAAVPIGAGVEATALRVTLATDSTGLISIDDNGGSITVDSAAAFTVQEDGAALTALQTIDNSIFVDDAAFTLTSSSVTIAGGIRDDSLSALAAAEGDAVPFRLSSTGALHVTGAGGGTQYNIDDVGGGTDTGTLSLVIRDDSLTTLTPADGDYVALRVNSTGALHVTGGGGGTEYTEDVATANPIVGTATVMERDDALSELTPVESDWAAFRCSAEGALWVQEFNSDAILADTASMDTNLGTLAGAVAGSEMQVDIVTVPAPLNVVGGGTEAAALRVTIANNSTGLVSIDDGGGVITVDNGGTFVVQEDGAALTALELIDNIVSVDDAGYTLGAGSGVMMMGFAGAQSVDANDSAALACETDGALHIHDGGNAITVDWAGTAPPIGAGTEATALRVTIATDSTGLVSVDDNGGSLTIDGTVTANLSAADNAVLDDIAAKLAPHTTNGHTPYLNQDTSAIDAVKGSAGTVYWVTCMSTDATPVYLNLYDSTTATLGSTTPTNQFVVPSQGDANGAGFTINFGPLGMQYETGIQVAAATAFDGSTDPGTNVVITNMGFE